MNEPDFIVAGTARAGTSALHYYLRQHPGVFLPAQKEPCYYSFAGTKPDYKFGKFAFTITDKKKYSSLYKKVSADKVKGDISTPYLYLYNQTVSNIRKLHSNPENLKVIIILRNPVERAWSQYLWKVRDGRENLTFEEALKDEKKRMAENYSFDYYYASRGLYYEQVKAYLDNFKSVKIFLFDDFKNSFHTTMRDVCEFIGADPDFEFEKRGNINSSSVPRFAALGKIITLESRVKYRILNYLPDSVRIGIKEQFLKWNSTGKVPSPPSVKTLENLREFYRKDIGKLQALTGINFSSWLNP